MGQYHYILNLDKKQMLHPHELGDGLKLMEFGASGQGTMMCLAVLLADSNGRGGGDCRGTDPDGLIGSWAGDRIAICGDYGDKCYDLEGAADNTNAHTLAGDAFDDISSRIREVVHQDTPLSG